MKKWSAARLTAVFVLVAAALIFISGVAVCYDDYDSSAYGDAQRTADYSSAFDGGGGSNINTSSSYSSSVPDVGEGRAYGYQDADGNYHSY